MFLRQINQLISIYKYTFSRFPPPQYTYHKKEKKRNNFKLEIFNFHNL